MDEDGQAGDTDEIKQVLEQMGPVIGRISKLLQQHEGRRVNSSDSLGLWFLRFLELELSGISESLRELPLSDLGPDFIDSTMAIWLMGLSTLAKDIGTELDNHEQFGSIVHCFRHTRLPVPFSDEMKLRLFLQVVSSITESLCRYKHLLLADDGEITSRTTSLLQTHHCVETNASNMPLVGIESVLGNMKLRWFMDDQEEYRIPKIISMVGPVGVGKTAIAMEVYRRLQSRGGEEGNLLCCATAKVSRKPDMKKLLLHILSQIDEPEALALAPIDELGLLVHKISQCLQDRRYLIVIDDIWEISHWEIMKNAFPQNNRGGWIVITTRIRSIANKCCSYSIEHVHEVRSLSELDSEMLLFRKAFGCEVDYPSENLRQVCGEILRRCDGIPLFINGMADWLKEQQQRVWHISNYSMEEVPQLLNIFERALSPTYDGLSYEMKVLVLYMSMFPEGYMFEEHTLCCRWKWDVDYLDAHIFIKLFSDLVDRNVITRVANWKRTSQLAEEWHFYIEKEEWRYKLNYFMLQFLASKSSDKGIFCASGFLAGVKHNEKLRRISLHRPDPDLETFLKTRDFSRTCSLAISSTVDGVPLEKFIHLMVLDLEGWQCFKDEDLLLICNSGMFLLKYFSMRNTSVSRLPPEIKNLIMLATLVASHTQITELPPEVCELYLESLDLRSTKIRQLPENIWKAPTLETLLVGGDGANCGPTITKVPMGSRTTSCITRLETVDLSECSADIIHSLCCFKYLDMLCIRWSFHQCSDAELKKALCSCIEGWGYLCSLTIHCELGCPMDFLACLPGPNAEIVEFKVAGGRFLAIPRWFPAKKYLACIEITVCTLEQEDLGILASLPSLQLLILGLHFVPGKKIVIAGEGFHRLERLSICCRVPWLSFHEGAMPLLDYLELKISGGLGSEERIPSGLRNLASLRELALHYSAWYINDSNVRTIVNAVRKGVAEHHNPINLIINGIEEEEEYVQEAGDGVAVINRIQEHNEKHEEAEEDAARATGSQSEIEIVDTPKLYDQSSASHTQDSRWYPEDEH